MTNQPLYLRTLVVSLIILSLAACGESDLLKLQEKELDDARQLAAQAPSLGPANPVTDGNTDTGGTTTGDGATAGESDTGNTSGDTTDGGTTGSDSGATGTTAGSTDAGNTTAGTDTGSSTGGQSNSAIDLSQYDLVFSDDFRGSSIDPVKWNTALAWGPDLIVYDQLQYYVDTLNNPDFGYNPFTLDGEQLTITAIETPEELRAAANEQPWLSGVLTTADKFDFTHGYVEARVDLQPGRGIWPAFWMLSSEFEGLKPELFIMEYDGAKPNSIFHNYNYQDVDGNLRSPGQWEVSSSGISEGFHTVGVAWSPDELLFYIDGQPRYRIVGENVPSQDMYLILNLAMGGLWPGAPDGTTPTPSSIVVDYVRAYQMKP